MSKCYVIFVDDDEFIAVRPPQCERVTRHDLNQYVGPLKKLGIPVPDLNTISMVNVGLFLAGVDPDRQGVAEEIKQQLKKIKTAELGSELQVQPSLHVEDGSLDVIFRADRESALADRATQVPDAS